MNPSTAEDRATTSTRHRGVDSSALYLTPVEVAELLRTTRAAVYTMVQRGQLPGVRRIGRRILVQRAELLRWIEKQASRDGSHSETSPNPLNPTRCIHGT